MRRKTGPFRAASGEWSGVLGGVGVGERGRGGSAKEKNITAQGCAEDQKTICGQCSGNPYPYNLSKKGRQYTSNLYGSTPPISIAVLSWLLSFEERETLQYASHLYCSTPPICTAVRPPFVGGFFMGLV